jgi:hypothetical protein
MDRSWKSKDVWGKVLAVVRPALELASPEFLNDRRSMLFELGVTRAVATRDNRALFDWLLGVVQYQGMSDANVDAFTASNGHVGWTDIASAIAAAPSCRKLGSYWAFDGCGYRKTARSCAEPGLMSSCPLPALPLRNGRLSQAAFSLFLFMRDVCGGDLVGWIDQRLEQADTVQNPDRGAAMRQAILEPLGHVHGVSSKVLSMALSDLLLIADPDRQRWVSTGASMVVIDTLVHNFLHRTGTLRLLDADHAYGPRCYAPGGCADIIAGIADRFDARSVNPAFPACFPRFVEHAVWRFCAANRFNI